MYGGKILRVDSDSGKIETEPTGNLASDFLGGRGIDARLLYNETKAGQDPLDPSSLFPFFV